MFVDMGGRGGIETPKIDYVIYECSLIYSPNFEHLTNFGLYNHLKHFLGVACAKMGSIMATMS